MNGAHQEASEMSRNQTEGGALTALFREVVLVLGGVFAVRGTDDETVRQVAAGLERAWRRARSKTRSSTDGRPAPHPAIAALLRLTTEEDQA
jgi:hypothetical protein